MTGRQLAAVAGCWGAALVAVLVLRAALGPWPAALVLVPVLVALVAAGWSIAERALFPDTPPPPAPAGRPQVERTGSAQLDDARARALAELADAWIDAHNSAPPGVRAR